MSSKNGASLVGGARCEHPSEREVLDLLLDSSLILATDSETYNVKLISCGDYIQIYSFQDEKVKKVKDIEKISEDKKINYIDTDNLFKIDKTNSSNTTKEKKIEFKNINRSKLECQRLAKANSNEWRTFITLTFEENITDINYANKKLKYFIDKIRRIFKNFKYICIPEFQKRGAVHYHLLTNISIDDERFIFAQEDNKKFKHIKYWNEGFTKVDNLYKDIKKIIGYISKYMTKDIDNRLYNHHRYLFSRNLEKPKISYLDLNNEKHLEFYMNIINNKTEIYNNIYKSTYTEELIEFQEFL
ncbi:MAG: hypothetical protein E7170_03530 [Firmicutes bacterium]|nr:hypothetical protein [Bacillota bacterium]